LLRTKSRAKAQRPAIDRVAFLGDFDGFGHEVGPRPTRRDDTVALHLEPFLQQLDVRGAADPVGALDGDQFAFEVTRI
jgi:hypothetical protein